MASREPQSTITAAQYGFFWALTNILISIVVLNLFVEYVDTVVIDSFTVSILTAVLLWLIVRVVMGLERRVADYFRRKEGRLFVVLRVVSVWSILFLSKFVILEAVALVFGGRATLGQFFEVVAITLTLIVAEALLRWVFRRLGRSSTSEGEAADR